jgi:hypothetical protein
MADDTASTISSTGQRGDPSDIDETPENPEQLCGYWLQQIQYAERKFKFFRTRGDQIIRRYRNKRSTATPTVTNITVGQRRMNVLWANVELQMPFFYSQTPKANVSRRNKDKDPTGRWAALVLERVLQNSMAMRDFDYVIEQDLQNLLLPGWGCSMVEYIPEIQPEMEGQPEQVVWQEARLRYVNWRDQLTNPARYWEEVTWWAYVSYLTRKEVSAAYGPQIASEIALDHKPSKDTDDTMSKATVWCIWDKTSEKVLHVSTGYSKAPLGIYDPPVQFDGFFPIPRPLLGTIAPDSIIPTPDFDQYQDQADEIDLLTQRIYVLTRSLRLRGLYPGDMQSVKQLMDESTDADLIPVENWSSFTERGGSQGLVQWFPIEQVAQTLEWCYKARDIAVETMNKILGLSDIMQGQTDPNEALGTQQIKGQFGSLRPRDRQRDVQRYIRDLLRHSASVVGQHFTQEVIQKMSGAPLLTDQQKQAITLYQQRVAQMQQQWQQAAQMAQQAGQQPPPPPQLPQPAPTPDMMEAMQEPSWEQVIQLLRDEKMRGFMIDIETDSTVEADQIQEQNKAQQFLTGISQFMEAWAPLIEKSPPQIAGAMAKLGGELLMFGIRHYKAGESIETQIEEAVATIEKVTEQATNAPPMPDPKTQAATITAQAKVQEAGIHAQTAQVKGAAEQQKAKIDLIETAVDHQATMREKAADLALANAQPQAPVLPQ